MRTLAFLFQMAHFVENTVVPSNLYKEVGTDLRSKTRGRDVIFNLLNYRFSHLILTSSLQWTESSYLPRFICWSPYTQGDGTGRWGLWAVSKPWVFGPHEWDLCPYKKRGGRDDLPLYHRKDTVRRHSAIRKEEGPHQNLLMLALWPWTSSFPIMRHKFLLLKSLSLWHIIAADWLRHSPPPFLPIGFISHLHHDIISK